MRETTREGKEGEGSSGGADGTWIVMETHADLKIIVMAHA